MIGSPVVPSYLARDTTLQQVLAEVQTQQKNALTDFQLRASPVQVSTGLVQPLTNAELRASSIQVNTGLVQALTNSELRASPVPVNTGLSQGLTNTELRAFPVQMKDAYSSGEYLADQPAAGAALTFTFSSPVQLVYVYGVSSGGSNTYRADPFGGTPTASAGIPCPDGAPIAIPVQTSTVKVFGASGTVSVWGFRY